MPTPQECNAYASEVARRFEEFSQWAIDNWPDKSYPLMSSDFAQARQEIGLLLGSRLRDGPSSGSPATDETAQYRDVTPAPWP